MGCLLLLSSAFPRMECKSWKLLLLCVMDTPAGHCEVGNERPLVVEAMAFVPGIKREGIASTVIPW